MVVLAYLSAAGLALRAWSSVRRPIQLSVEDAPVRRPDSASVVWLFAAIVLFVLGVNKLFDTQEWVLDSLRASARADGWYANRRCYQTVIVVGIAAVGVAVSGAIACRFRRKTGRPWGAVLGLGLLLVFVAVRAVSFHYVDELLQRGEIRLSVVIELVGIAVVAVSATRATRLGPPLASKQFFQ